MIRHQFTLSKKQRDDGGWEVNLIAVETVAGYSNGRGSVTTWLLEQEPELKIETRNGD